MEQNNLQRFIDAQEKDYALALAEIKNGKKVSHWMWYIFPQLAGLGQSEMAKRYAIKDIEEAKEYLQNPILGSRLVEISNALLSLENTDALTIFGHTDCMKLKSSMTLFFSVEGSNEVFWDVLKKFFKGKVDEFTIQLLKQ